MNELHKCVARALATSDGQNYDKIVAKAHDPLYYAHGRGLMWTQMQMYDRRAAAVLALLEPVMRSLVSGLVPLAGAANAIARDTESYYREDTMLCNALHMSAPYHPKLTVGDAQRAAKALEVYDATAAD